MADLLLDLRKPVVFVAAMRNLSETGGDGPRNLADALFASSRHKKVSLPRRDEPRGYTEPRVPRRYIPTPF